MKNYLTIFLLFISISLFAQKSGKIYYFSFSIDEELREIFKESTDDRNFLSGYSEKEIFPKAFIDSMIQATEVTLSEITEADIKAFFRKNRKGEKVTSIAVNEQLGGLPANTFRQAQKSTDADYFIKITTDITKGGYALDFGTHVLKKYKPKIIVRVKVMNSNKDKILKEKVKIKKFTSLKSRTDKVNIDGVEYDVTNSETLTPLDIMFIYFKALEKLKKIAP